MEILELLVAFAVIGFIFNLITNCFKSLTGKELSSDTVDETKKELQKKVLNSKPANYLMNGLFSEEHIQQHNFNNEQ